MPEEENIEKLFEFAIEVEKHLNDFYLALAEKFSHIPEAPRFWKKMAGHEAKHAAELRKISESLAPDQLLMPPDRLIMEKVKASLDNPVLEKVDMVKNLREAYDLAHDLEYSEINTVYASLIKEFAPRDDRKKFLLSEISEHLKTLMDFSDAMKEKGIF